MKKQESIAFLIDHLVIDEQGEVIFLAEWIIRKVLQDPGLARRVMLFNDELLERDDGSVADGDHVGSI